jgi:hypothetical protein
MSAVRPGPGLDLAEVLKGPWEPGVVARYLTAGWASVDVVDATMPSTGAVKHTVSVVCRGEGCTWPPPEPQDFYVLTSTPKSEDAEQLAHTYQGHLYTLKCEAQRHAEECRAMQRRGTVMEAAPPRREIEPRWSRRTA